MDVRNDQTGEVIFKDSLKSAIAGVVKVKQVFSSIILSDIHQFDL